MVSSCRERQRKTKESTRFSLKTGIGRLGFNDPDRYGTTFSLRKELFRRPGGEAGDTAFRLDLEDMKKDHLLALSEVAAHPLQIDGDFGAPVPGIAIDFSTVIESGLNFFGKSLAASDNHRFTESNFATKIHSVGIIFEGYKGMDPCLVCPVPGPSTADHPNALAATPHVCLLPTGQDLMRTPPLGDRSVANTGWVLVIPGKELLDNPVEGIRRFIDSVTDIKLYIKSYSYSGN